MGSSLSWGPTSTSPGSPSTGLSLSANRICRCPGCSAGMASMHPRDPATRGDTHHTRSREAPRCWHSSQSPKEPARRGAD
ncbi:hypothetical protein FKM82_002601 [Ascaphus truei]